MADWRDKMVVALHEIAVGEGIIVYDKEKVETLLRKLGDLERDKPKKDRKGFAYAVDNYSASGLNTLLKKAAKLWAEDTRQVPQAPPSVPPEEDCPAEAAEIGHAEEQATTSTKPPTKPKMRCTLAICMPSKANDHPDVDGMMLDAMKTHLIEQVSFGVLVEDCKHVHDDWWDLLVSYQKDLIKIYDKIFDHEWVDDAVTKPAADFGKRTTATVR